MSALNFPALAKSVEVSDIKLNKKRNEKSFKSQLLKWVGNKQKVAEEIISYFPKDYVRYIEPFLGSGGVLGVLNPSKAIAGDIFGPLMEIWICLKSDKEKLKQWYLERYLLIEKYGKKEAYSFVLDRYNHSPNGPDFLFLIRTCYGGIVRFRKKDGFMSTPCGSHSPMPPDKFGKRVDEWSLRIINTTFINSDFSELMCKAGKGDLIYCDPPYLKSQSILYGAQSFDFKKLIYCIEECKKRGAKVALSIDGKSLLNDHDFNFNVPAGLFEREILINVGRSMLKRFQMKGETLEKHVVSDRLLLTY